MTSISEKLYVDTQEFEVKHNTHVPPKDTTDDGSVRCSLKIEVIDDTAMIDISQGGKCRTVDKRSKSRTNKKKKNARKENGEKMAARKAKGRNMAEAKEKNLLISDGSIRKGREEKMVYRRKELENLRFIGIEEQRKKWAEVYCGLDETVQKEYDGLLQSNTQKHIRGHLGKENTPVISGNDHSGHLDDQEGSIDTRNSPSAFPLSGDGGISCEGERDVSEESDDSNDDYSSIQRPAFIVTGEPDFDSGPPEDGLEYLRRVSPVTAHLAIPTKNNNDAYDQWVLFSRAFIPAAKLTVHAFLCQSRRLRIFHDMSEICGCGQKVEALTRVKAHESIC